MKARSALGNFMPDEDYEIGVAVKTPKRRVMQGGGVARTRWLKLDPRIHTLLGEWRPQKSISMFVAGIVRLMTRHKRVFIWKPKQFCPSSLESRVEVGCWCPAKRWIWKSRDFPTPNAVSEPSALCRVIANRWCSMAHRLSERLSLSNWGFGGWMPCISRRQNERQRMFC